MSDENEKNETKDMLEKIDEQLQKHMKSLEKAEKGLKSAQQKIRTCKKAISDIQKMRSAIIGEKVVAMGFDTPQELERLYALAQEKKLGISNTASTPAFNAISALVFLSKTAGAPL